MKNPQVLAALQDKLGSIIGTPSGYIQSWVFGTCIMLDGRCCCCSLSCVVTNYHALVLMWLFGDWEGRSVPLLKLWWLPSGKGWEICTWNHFTTHSSLVAQTLTWFSPVVLLRWLRDNVQTAMPPAWNKALFDIICLHLIAGAEWFKNKIKKSATLDRKWSLAHMLPFTHIHTHTHCSCTQTCACWRNYWLCVVCRLPKPVKRRIKALKKLQNDVIQLESQFYKEVHVLECKYATQYASLFDKVSSLQLHTLFSPFFFFFRVETWYD